MYSITTVKQHWPGKKQIDRTGPHEAENDFDLFVAPFRPFGVAPTADEMDLALPLTEADCTEEAKEMSSGYCADTGCGSEAREPHNPAGAAGGTRVTVLLADSVDRSDVLLPTGLSTAGVSVPAVLPALGSKGSAGKTCILLELEEAAEALNGIAGKDGFGSAPGAVTDETLACPSALCGFEKYSGSAPGAATDEMLACPSAFCGFEKYIGLLLLGVVSAT